MKMGAVIGQLIAQNTRPTGTNTDQKSSAGYRFLQSLEKGSVFEGTILEIKNGQVTIGLANGDLLHARLDMDLSLIQGGSLFFQVKAADENQIASKEFRLCLQLYGYICRIRTAIFASDDIRDSFPILSPEFPNRKKGNDQGN